MVSFRFRTEPSPNRALNPPVWAEPNPGSQYQFEPLALLVQSIRGHCESGIGAIQLPANRVLGQSALWAQPGSSHQSQTFAWYCRAATAFSATAIVFEVPSVTLTSFTVPYLTDPA